MQALLEDLSGKDSRGETKLDWEWAMSSYVKDSLPASVSEAFSTQLEGGGGGRTIPLGRLVEALE